VAWNVEGEAWSGRDLRRVLLLAAAAKKRLDVKLRDEGLIKRMSLV